MLDLVLACLHHLLIFAIFGLILFEFLMLKPGIDAAGIKRVARIDAMYGVAAGLIVIVGFSRAIFAAKGWHYYSHNGWFWAKMGTFALIGLMSIPPTLTLARWRRSGTAPTASDLKPVRRLLHYELGLFMLLPLFAAAMARGLGEF
jgi:putative membrane protein